MNDFHQNKFWVTAYILSHAVQWELPCRSSTACILAQRSRLFYGDGCLTSTIAFWFHKFSSLFWDAHIPKHSSLLLQYIPRNMHTVFALLCFVVVIHWLIFTYPSGLLHWHCGNLTIAPVPAKQPWWIWINTSCEFIMNDCITTTKQSITKPCAYFLGYTVATQSLNKLDYTKGIGHKQFGIQWLVSETTPGVYSIDETSVIVNSKIK